MIINRLRLWFLRHWKGPSQRSRTVRTLPRHKHRLTRNDISPNALKVLYRLKNTGYTAYLVGGGVRDLLLGRAPKDFDVVTDAHPEHLRKLFKNSRLIGRRFRLVHVFFRGEIIEVSTFRANTQDGKPPVYEDSVPTTLLADNTYGTIEEDAWRRDFTANALYYNIADYSVSDFTGGISDLKRRLIRMIGDPVQRYHEDPVRLLRAIRLAAKLGFDIAPETAAPLTALSSLLQHVPVMRLFEELLKLFFEGNAVASYQRLHDYGYIAVLFAQTDRPADQSLSSEEPHFNEQKFIRLAMEATDQRFSKKQSLNPGFLLSALLWPLVLFHLEKEKETCPYFYQALHHTVSSVLKAQNVKLRVPKRFTAMMRSIWLLQFQLLSRRSERVNRVLSHRYFRAAFDFLLLRVQAGAPYHHVVRWWEKQRTTQ